MRGTSGNFLQSAIENGLVGIVDYVDLPIKNAWWIFPVRFFYVKPVWLFPYIYLFFKCRFSISHMLHVWNIYQHLPHKLPKCR